MATPAYGTILLVSPKGVTRAIDMYLSDVANAQANFDEGQGATTTSATKFPIPFSGYLKDISLENDIVDCEALQLTVNGAPSGDFFRSVNHLSTAERMKFAIPVLAGQEIGIIQRT